MTSLLFTVSGAVVNELACSGTNFIFSRLMDHGAEQRKSHDLVLEKLQMARDEWNRDQMKRLDFINKRPHEKNEARADINNVDEAMLEYSPVFAKQTNSLPPEIFIIHQGRKKAVNYLLQWAQVLQHMLCTNTFEDR